MMRWALVAMALGCTPKATCPAGVPDGEGNCVLDTDEADADADTDADSDSDADSDTDSDTDTDDVGAGTNWACMSDGDFPAGQVDDPSLRKTVTVAVTAAQADLDLGDVTLSRPSLSSSYTYLMLPVTNVGPVPLCFVRINDISFTDGIDELAYEDFSYVEGSIQDVGPLYTGTCLLPGESGFFKEITEVDFDLVTEVRFTMEPADQDGLPPAGHVVPTGYTVDGHEAAIEAEHLLGGSLSVNTISTWLLRDGAGDPVHWGFASADDPQVMTPGDTITFDILAIGFDQVGSEICLWTDFESSARSGSPAVNCPDRLGQAACENLRWGDRNGREAAAQGR